MCPPAEPTDLSRIRAWYAEELRLVANLQSEAVVTAFAEVPREQFLGDGPWHVWTTSAPGDPYQPRLGYRVTPDANPAHVYHNVAIALDAERQINNGHPSSAAAWIDWLRLTPGLTVYHVGSGTGYYTAVLARIVGPTGRVIGIEIDEAFARTARSRLAHLAWVESVQGTAATYDPGPVDAVLANVGVTHPPPAWVARLRPGGRMLLPLTFGFRGGTVGAGAMLAVRRLEASVEARFLPGQVMFYSGTGLRTDEANDRLGHAFARGGAEAVRSLRTTPHAEDATCWLHRPEGCLSTAEGAS